MNANRDLLKRLLKLYPIKVVREHFKVSGSAEDVIEEITGSVGMKTIKEFAYDNQALTKQHIHLYEISKKFDPTLLDELSMKVEMQAKGSANTFHFLPKVTHKVVLQNELEHAEVQFWQPLVIHVIGKTVIVCHTKVEKDISNYFAPDRNALRAGLENGEKDSLVEIKHFLIDNFGASSLDFNIGIKTIWDKDVLDGKKVQWRRSGSIAQETMDEKLTYKKKYPEDYKKLISNPLVKCQFKYLLADEKLIDRFEADPSSGQINISRYPKDKKQILNVISEVLKNN